MIRSVLLIALIMVIAACVTPGGMSSSGSARGSVADFLVEGGGMQYFVKPISLEDGERDVEMSLDITFRIGATHSDSATINFTMVGAQAPRSVDSACLQSARSCRQLDRLKSLFVERHANDIHARFTSAVGQQSLFSMMQDPQWALLVWSGTQQFRFTVSSRGRKAIAATYTGIVEPSLPIPTNP